MLLVILAELKNIKTVACQGQKQKLLSTPASYAHRCLFHRIEKIESMQTCTDSAITCFESVYPPHCGPSCTVPYLTSECEEQASGATSVQGAAGRRGSTAQTTATGTNLSHLNYSSSRWIPFLLNFKLKQTYSPRFSALFPCILCHPT